MWVQRVGSLRPDPIMVWWGPGVSSSPENRMKDPLLASGGWLGWHDVQKGAVALLLLATTVFGDGGGARCGRCVVPHVWLAEPDDPNRQGQRGQEMAGRYRRHPANVILLLNRSSPPFLYERS